MKHVSLNRFFLTACLLFGLTAILLPINHVLMPDVDAKSQYQGSPKLPMNRFSHTTEAIHTGNKNTMLSPTPLNDGTPEQTGEAMPPEPLVESPIEVFAETTTSDKDAETSDDKPVTNSVETAQKTEPLTQPKQDVAQTSSDKTTEKKSVAKTKDAVKQDAPVATKTMPATPTAVPTETTVVTEPLKMKTKSKKADTTTATVVETSPKPEAKVTPVSTASVSTQPVTRTALDWYNEASQLGRRGKFRNAIKAYSQALTLKPDFADARVGLAAAYGSLGNWSKVIQELEQVVDMSSSQFGTPFNKVQAQYNLTAAYCMTGSSNKAKNLLRQVDKADHPHVNNLKNFVDARCP